MRALDRLVRDRFERLIAAMPEVRFYHLSATPLEANLPPMLEMALDRGWRVVVRCGSEAGMAMLDKALWTWRDDAFLPHGTAAAGHAAAAAGLPDARRGEPGRRQAC